MLAWLARYVRDMPRIATLVDTLTDRAVVPGYTRLGPAVRRHLSTWPADPPSDALAGQRALVTGASSGLGVATVEGLAALGAEVVLVVRDTDKGAKVVREIHGRLPLARLDVQRCDLADLDDVRRFAAADSGDVDVLIHNAGAMPPTPQPRPTQLLRRTRTGDAERNRLWAWVTEQLGL
jgi:FlaA1/EpsC-like NDP-sugar epimerase